MKHYRIIAEQSDELTELFNRCDPTIAIVEGRECWLADDIDVDQMVELHDAALPLRYVPQAANEKRVIWNEDLLSKYPALAALVAAGVVRSNSGAWDSDEFLDETATGLKMYVPERKPPQSAWRKQENARIERELFRETQEDRLRGRD